MFKKYTIGIDFGSLSGRAALVDVTNGDIIAEYSKDYLHGIVDRCLPDGAPLDTNWALQDPGDYLDVLETVIPSVLKMGKAKAEEVIGIGIDFTSSTVMPINKDGIPLCFFEQFRKEPHAWPKLWKHHAAQEEADIMTEVAKAREEYFLKTHGWKVSSETMLPKIFQVLREAPEIYEAADRFIEAGDWIVFNLIGKEARSSFLAGFRAMWNQSAGYPSHEYLRLLDSRFEKLPEDKLNWSPDDNHKLYAPGEKVGGLSENMAEKIGLLAGTSVTAASMDAHVAVSAVGITEPGKVLMVMGTSNGILLLNEEEVPIYGISGIMRDGILPGYYAYASGQSSVGDCFDWFISNCVPQEYYQKAKDAGMNIHDYLSMKASKIKPGESGLLALDWWNGNRSCLSDANLTGMVLGMTLHTKVEEIYRSLIEATAYGAAKIFKTFTEAGIKIDELYACGGISIKNKLLMQIFADITNRKISVAESDQVSALGSAIFAAVAAGALNGGYDSVFDAIDHMAQRMKVSYEPIEEHVEIYTKLFSEYERLHDYFGRGDNNVMKRLKYIMQEVKQYEN